MMHILNFFQKIIEMYRCSLNNAKTNSVLLFQDIPNPVDGENIEVHFPTGFAAEEITVLLEPKTGLAPKLFDVEIVACLSEF